MVVYYDIVLGLIPTTFAALAGVLAATGVELTLAVVIASVAAVLLVGHAMFVRAPVGPQSATGPAGAN